MGLKLASEEYTLISLGSFKHFLLDRYLISFGVGMILFWGA
jgi:hypothetical protein